jgi:type I restriction enzyme S subunit
VANLKTKATLNSGIFLTRPLKNDYSTRYMYWVLNSDVFNGFINSTKTGSTIAHLYQHVFVRFTFPLPLPKEQQSIADFLDLETIRIDTLVQKKNELIVKLLEKRTAVIHNAVTRGLNPRAKLKESGIDWIGLMPLKWEVMKLKYVSQGVQTGITPPSEQLEYFEEEVNWYTPGDFSFDLLLKDSKRKLSELAFEDGVARYFPANSVLLVGIGATLGKVGYIDKPASSNQQINAIFFDNLEQAKYYSYYLLVNQPNVVSYANASTLAILNQAQTKDIPVIVPDFEEMKQIVSYLEVETTKIDNMVCEVEKAISKLQEYRTALITATVTGKINISN